MTATIPGDDAVFISPPVQCTADIHHGITRGRSFTAVAPRMWKSFFWTSAISLLYAVFVDRQQTQMTFSFKSLLIPPTLCASDSAGFPLIWCAIQIYLLIYLTKICN